MALGQSSEKFSNNLEDSNTSKKTDFSGQVSELLEENPAIQERHGKSIEVLDDKLDNQVMTQNEKLRQLEKNVFDYLILSSLQDVFKDSLKKVGFSQEETNSIIESLQEKNDDEMRSIFSTYAYENKEKMMQHCKEKVSSGELSSADIPEYLLEKAEEFNFDIGFHTSGAEIDPDKEKGAWTINGAEKDHRFGDHPMAYYSTDYEHLYVEEGGAEFMYVVRIQEAGGSGHRKAGNNWGMAPSLPVIARFDLHEVRGFVRNRAYQHHEEIDKK